MEMHCHSRHTHTERRPPAQLSAQRGRAPRGPPSRARIIHHASLLVAQFLAAPPRRRNGRCPGSRRVAAARAAPAASAAPSARAPPACAGTRPIHRSTRQGAHFARPAACAAGRPPERSRCARRRCPSGRPRGSCPASPAAAEGGGGGRLGRHGLLCRRGRASSRHQGSAGLAERSAGRGGRRGAAPRARKGASSRLLSISLLSARLCSARAEKPSSTHGR